MSSKKIVHSIVKKRSKTIYEFFLTYFSSKITVLRVIIIQPTKKKRSETTYENN